MIRMTSLKSLLVAVVVLTGCWSSFTAAVGGHGEEDIARNIFINLEDNFSEEWMEHALNRTRNKHSSWRQGTRPGTTSSPWTSNNGDDGDNGSSGTIEISGRNLPAKPLAKPTPKNATAKKGKTEDAKKRVKSTKRPLTKEEEDVRRMFSKEAQEELRYVLEPDIMDPVLRHGDMYDNVMFYPVYTYNGFYSPPIWHEVPIHYFLRSVRIFHNITKKEHLRHRSLMNMCSPLVMQEMDPRLVAKDVPCYTLIHNECASLMPSPINILSRVARLDPKLDRVTFLNFDIYFAYTLVLPEDGTDMLTLKLSIPKALLPRKPGIKGGGLLPGTPKEGLFLDRILLHVGENSRVGSEHTIDGQTFGMEVQFIFTKDGALNLTYWETLAQYKVISPERKEEIGKNVHIVSVLGKVGKPGENGTNYAIVFDQVAEAATMLWKNNNPEYFRAVTTGRKQVSLESFLEESVKGNYYTYMGSLTHPPCFTHVGWTVYEMPVLITFEAWFKFSMIHSEYSDRKHIGGNYRPQDTIVMHGMLGTFSNWSKVSKEEPVPVLQAKLFPELYNDTSIIPVQYDGFMRYFASRVRKCIPPEIKEVKAEYDYYESETLPPSSARRLSRRTPTEMLFPSLLTLLLLLARKFVAI